MNRFEFVPVTVGMPLKLNGTGPLLVTVTERFSVVPCGTVPKASMNGLRLTSESFATPAPPR